MKLYNIKIAFFSAEKQHFLSSNITFTCFYKLLLKVLYTYNTFNKPRSGRRLRRAYMMRAKKVTRQTSVIETTEHVFHRYDTLPVLLVWVLKNKFSISQQKDSGVYLSSLVEITSLLEIFILVYLIQLW